MILVLLADGFEEIEALTPVDMLRRAGLEVKTVGISGRVAVGSHGIPVICDILPEEVELSAVDAVIFPGGLPGSTNLDASPFTDKVIEAVEKRGGRLAAICAAPMVLGHRGLLVGKRATCYPGFEKELHGADATGEDVVTDGRITTSRGMGTAQAFAEELVALLASEEKAIELSRGVMNPHPYEPKRVEAEAHTPDDIVFGDITKGAEKILAICESYGLKVNIDDIKHGHRVTRYIISSERKTHITKLARLEDDIMLELSTDSLMITVTGPNGLYIDVANREAELVRLADLTDSYEFTNAPSKTALVLGQDAERAMVFGDIARMPHLVIGGAVGMGKSVMINAIVLSLMKKCTPDELKFVMIDPKAVELGAFEGMPHLYAPIVTGASEAGAVLGELISEMEKRYDMLADAMARSIDDYNKKNEVKIPRIIVVIDELADLMMSDRRGIESAIVCLAQKARAAGIHLVIGTQKPDGGVLTPAIAVNIPARIAFKTVNTHDSRLLLGNGGATRLMNNGDALYSAGFGNAVRIQTPYVSCDEVADAVAEAKRLYGEG